MPRKSIALFELLLLSPALALADGDGEVAAVDSQTAPTYYEDVLPIFQERCESCHREGDIGPFTTADYEEASGWAAMIGEVVEDRRMPPWTADADVGEWKNSRRLSDAERAQILAWVKAGAPAGDKTRAPQAKQWPKGWKIGQPDAVIEMPRPFKVPATGAIDYQYMEVKTSFDEDKWITAAEVVPGAPEVVHHVLLFIHYPGAPRVRGGLGGYFLSGLPGAMAEYFPEGSAKYLPKGAVLEFQLHYTTNGRAQTDLTKVGLRFAKDAKEIKRRARTVALANQRFEIPAGVEDHQVKATFRFRRDVTLYGFQPHMHLRGKGFVYTLIDPAGQKRDLCRVTKYDFNWQDSYFLAEPLRIKSGSKIVGTAIYDNSPNNPANPDPSRSVDFGLQTWDEMMIGYLHVLEEGKPQKRGRFFRPR